MRSITSRVREAMRRHSSGITLIELIVTIAIFGAVTTVLLGSFITIFSVREQTTLSQEANDDIRVILDGIEREIQAGNDIEADGSNISFVVSSRGDVPPYPVKYRLYDSAIQKAVGNNAVSGDPCNFNTNSMAFADEEDCFLPITGDNVEISVLDFSVQAPEVEQAQTSPLVTLSLVGEVLDSAGKASPLTYSTSITPRNRVTVSDVEQTLGIGDPIVTLENILPPVGWGCQVSRVPYNPTDPPALPPEGFGSTFYTDCLGVNIDFSVDTGNSGLHSLRYANTTSGNGAVYQGTGEMGANIPVVFDTDANRLTLVAGSNNMVDVRTENLFGNSVTQSFEVRQVVFTDPSPGPVMNLNAATGACGSGEITLGWGAPTVVVGTAGPATGYEVTVGGVVEYSGPATTYTDTGVVTPNVDYYVRAYNLGGFGPSTTVTGTAPSACVGAPTVNLQASETTLTVGQPAYLTWTSQDADSCTASAVPAVPGWSGGKGVNGGPESTGALALGTYTFTLTCERAGNSNSDSVTVDVEYGVGCLTGTYYERWYKDQTSGTCPDVWGYPGLEAGCVNPVGGNLTASCDPVVNAGDYCVTQTADSCSPGNTFNRGKITCCKPGPIEPPCPFVADANTTIIDFDGVKRISNYNGERASTSYSVTIPAGTYTVRLAAWDGYFDRPATVPQLNEQYYVELMDGTVSRAVTGSTADLADGVAEAMDIRTVATGLVVPAGVDTLFTRHTVYGTPTGMLSANSVGPICAAFTREVPAPPVVQAGCFADTPDWDVAQNSCYSNSCFDGPTVSASFLGTDSHRIHFSVGDTVANRPGQGDAHIFTNPADWSVNWSGGCTPEGRQEWCSVANTGFISDMTVTATVTHLPSGTVLPPFNISGSNEISFMDPGPPVQNCP